ncbi:MAG: DUF2799 domain-containing protein [Roseitalea sp.]|jgi:hypothetical protein|nr:DUF2799 domain-containing protein [Roseitalea sp.]MBO6722977.1 DUF2799 domain-containing protein [Roseitalea sp.]MBO6744108.1 DUF2799 domain-containing protein [Roseitalea sp.]
MRYLVAAGVFGVAMMALSSCATLNEEQCQVVDWQQLGESDGTRGFPVTYVGQHQEACTKHGISVDAASWQTGWDRGIRTYCTPANGLNVGRSGGINRNACPADMALAFNEAHTVGRRVHDARTDRDEAQRKIDQLIRDLAAATTDEDRRRIQLEIELERNRLSSAQSAVFSAEREADLYQFRTAQAQ